MQSRYFEFGGDTLVRTDQYGPPSPFTRNTFLTLSQIYTSHVRPAVTRGLAVFSLAPDSNQLGGQEPKLFLQKDSLIFFTDRG